MGVPLAFSYIPLAFVTVQSCQCPRGLSSRQVPTGSGVELPKRMLTLAPRSREYT